MNAVKLTCPWISLEDNVIPFIAGLPSVTTADLDPILHPEELAFNIVESY
jgi:hypothetical protein